MFLIGLRYCGGCNPQIDRTGVICGLKKIGLRADYTTDKEKSVDLVLLLNGCMHACLEEEHVRSGHDSQFISVRGEMVNDQYVQEKSIPEFLNKKIMGLFQ